MNMAIVNARVPEAKARKSQIKNINNFFFRDKSVTEAEWKIYFK